MRILSTQCQYKYGTGIYRVRVQYVLYYRSAQSIIFRVISKCYHVIIAIRILCVNVRVSNDKCSTVQVYKYVTSNCCICTLRINVNHEKGDLRILIISLSLASTVQVRYVCIIY